MLKSPSKYIPLSRLKKIKQDYYRGMGGQEYAPCEVDELISAKQVREAEKFEAAQWHSYCKDNKPPPPTLESIRALMEKVQRDIISKR